MALISSLPPLSQYLFLPSPTMVKHTADWLKQNKRRKSPKLVQGKSSDAGLWVNSRGPNSSGQEDWPSDSRPSGDISFTFSAKMMASRLGTAARLFIQCDSLSSTPLPNLLLTTFPNSARSWELKKKFSSKNQNWVNRNFKNNPQLPLFICLKRENVKFQDGHHLGNSKCPL